MRKCHLVKVSLVAALIAPPAIAATIPDGIQWGVTREQVRARDFTFRGKKTEAVFRRWAIR